MTTHTTTTAHEPTTSVRIVTDEDSSVRSLSSLPGVSGRDVRDLSAASVDSASVWTDWTDLRSRAMDEGREDLSMVAAYRLADVLDSLDDMDDEDREILSRAENVDEVVLVLDVTYGLGSAVLSVEIVDEDGDEDVRDVDVSYVEPYSGAMLYRYDLPDSVDVWETAANLSGLPLSLNAHADGTVSLSLMAGGMDLSWSIAAAYVACGFLPPSWVRLPGMAGPVLSSVEEETTTAAAVLRSAYVAGLRARYAAEDVRRVATDRGLSLPDVEN